MVLRFLHTFTRSGRGVAFALRPSAGVRWRHLAQILVTALALAMIIRLIPWHDRVHLEDGTTAVVLDRSETSLTVRPLEQSDDQLREIPISAAQTVDPGVGVLLASARPLWLLACLACIAASSGLLVTRWGYLISRHGQIPSLRWCMVTWARSQVINLLPFSQIGGDLYRTERASHALGSAATSLGIIAAERMVGLLALLCVAAVGLAWASVSGNDITQGIVIRESTVALIIGGALSSVLIAWVVLNRMFGGGPGPSNNGHPSRWRARLHSLLSPLVQLTRRPRRLLGTLALSLAVQVLATLAYVIVDRALGFSTPVWCYLIAVPALTLAIFLPIHIAGIGIVEGGLWLFLSQWTDRAPADVIAISAAARIVALLWTGCLATSFAWPSRQRFPLRVRKDSAATEATCSTRWNAARPSALPSTQSATGIVWKP